MKAGRPIAVFLALISLVVAARAQELSISFAAGNFFATQDAYREIYGSGVPISADVWLKFKGPFGLAAGYGRLSDQGDAVPLGEDGGEYPVKFRRTAIPVTVFYQLDFKAVAVRFGAGLSFHDYEETWETVDLGFKGHKTSPRLTATAGYAVWNRLTVFGSVIYDTIPTGAGSPLVNVVNLGGFQLLGGLSFRIF